MSRLVLKRNESFTLRIGWLEKGINSFSEDNNLFKNKDANLILGLGSNMVKALKYYMQASNIIESVKGNYNFTEFGNTLIKNDRFLENDFSIQLIHYNLVKNHNLSPVFFDIFNSNSSYFTKESIINYLNNKYTSENFEFKLSTLSDEVNVFLNNYKESLNINPEENNSSILSKLHLFDFSEDSIKRVPLMINSFAFYYIILDLYQSNDIKFNIEDFIKLKNNPIFTFNYTKSMIYHTLNELEKLNLVKIVKTAGLNTCEVIKYMSLDEIYKKIKSGDLYV